MNILIATPTATELVERLYTSALAETVLDLTGRGVRVQYTSARFPIVAHNRDALAHLFFRGSYTHLLFIDADMEPAPKLAWEMLQFRLPFVAAIYPKRQISLPNMIKAARDGAENPEAFAYDFAFHTLPDGKITVQDNGLCELEAIGLGFSLIRRDCMASVAKAAPRHFSSLVNEEVAGIFQHLGADDEDYSFCQRWRSVGGKVMGYAHADVKHIGSFQYGVPFIKAFETVAR